jgi:hypothetical protein
MKEAAVIARKTLSLLWFRISYPTPFSVDMYTSLTSFRLGGEMPNILARLIYWIFPGSLTE